MSRAIAGACFCSLSPSVPPSFRRFARAAIKSTSAISTTSPSLMPPPASQQAGERARKHPICGRTHLQDRHNDGRVHRRHRCSDLDGAELRPVRMKSVSRSRALSRAVISFGSPPPRRRPWKRCSGSTDSNTSLVFFRE